MRLCRFLPCARFNAAYAREGDLSVDAVMRDGFAYAFLAPFPTLPFSLRAPLAAGAGRARGSGVSTGGEDHQDSAGGRSQRAAVPQGGGLA